MPEKIFFCVTAIIDLVRTKNFLQNQSFILPNTNSHVCGLESKKFSFWQNFLYLLNLAFGVNHLSSDQGHFDINIVVQMTKVCF